MYWAMPILFFSPKMSNRNVFQREKQQKLNEVECTIMLNLDQMQHFMGPLETCPISECLVFSKTTLTRLYKRVGDIQTETLKLKSRHLVNVKHLARMKTDLKYMHAEIVALKQQILDLVLLKFGKVLKIEVIDEHLEKKTFGDDIVNELMEALLRKMVHELRLSLVDVKSLYRNEIRLWEKRLENAEIEYTEALKDNTARLDLLGLLKKEKLELSSQIANQDKKREMVEKKKGNAEQIDVELSHLKKILREQQAQIDDMRKEIRLLKSKTRYPPGMKLSDEKLETSKREALEDVEHAQEYLYPEMIGEGSSDIQLTAPAESVASDAELKKGEVIKAIVREIMENFDVKLEAISLENFIRESIYPMIDYATIHEIVQEIVNKIGLKPSKEQLEALWSSSDLLKISDESLVKSEYLMREPTSRPPPISKMTSSEIKLYVGMIMDDILKDMMSQTEEFKYHLSFCNVMMRAVEEIPLEILKQESAADTISERLTACSCFSKDSIDKFKMAEVVQVWEECLCGSKDSIDKVDLAEVEIDWDDKEAPFRRMVDALLNRVFATGLDYIIFHR